LCCFDRASCRTQLYPFLRLSSSYGSEDWARPVLRTIRELQCPHSRSEFSLTFLHLLPSPILIYFRFSHSAQSSFFSYFPFSVSFIQTPLPDHLRLTVCSCSAILVHFAACCPGRSKLTKFSACGLRANTFANLLARNLNLKFYFSHHVWLGFIWSVTTFILAPCTHHRFVLCHLYL
jgi:hypothetical protein